MDRRPSGHKLERALSRLFATGERLPEWAAAAALLLALAGLVFARVVLRPGLMVAGADFLQFFFWENFTREELAAGRLPLWNPYFFSGYPASANPQTMVFYPPAVALRLLPVSYAFGVGIMLHTWWAGLGMYWLTRRGGVSRAGALVSAVAFMLSGSVVAHIEGGHLEWLYSIAWVPWVVLWGQRTLAENSCHTPIIFGLVAAMLFLAGAAKIAVCAEVLLIVLALFWLVRGVGNRAWRDLLGGAGRVGLGGLIAMGAAAIQLLPSVEFAALSSRAEGTLLQCAMRFSLNAADLATLGLARSPAEHLVFLKWERNGYVGALGLTLAVVAVLSRWGSDAGRTALWLSWGAAGLLLGLGPGLPFFSIARQVVPGLALVRQPFTFIVLLCFAGAGLAGLGFDRLIRSANGAAPILARPWPLLAAAALFLLSVASDAMLYLARPADPGGSLNATISWLAGFSAPRYALAIPCLWLLSRPGYRRLAASAVVAVLYVDLWFFSYLHIPILPASTNDELVAAVAEVDAAAGRIVTDPYMFSGVSMSRRTANAQGYAPIVLQTYSDFVVGSRAPSPCPDFEHVELDLTDLRLLRQLSVRYIDSRRPLALELPEERIGWKYVYEIPHPYPRALWVGLAAPAATAAEAIARVRAPEYDPLRVIYVEEAAAGNQGEAVEGLPAQIVTYEPQAVVITVDAPAEGYVLLNDVWYPGWRAAVDGRPAPVYRANGTFRAVPVPAGRSTVVMTYQSTYLGMGAGITILTLILGTGMLVAGVVRRRAG